MGVGPGTGRGVGPGEGGGIGGGPYRPNSGIEPPGLLRDVKVLRRLGSGLDEQAVEAVRQWRFSPARRLGTPVAVIVEVAVEFTLR